MLKLFMFVLSGMSSLTLFLLSFLLIFFYGSFSWFGLGFSFGVDYFSWWMILLTVWVSCMCMLIENNLFIKLLVMVLIFVFSTKDLIVFFFAFEASAIPLFFLIVSGGYQPERLQAGIYFLIYTVFASVPLLVSFFLLMKKGGSFNMEILFINNSLFMYVFMTLAFVVKIPMYFVHLWLPKAHVEAPVIGSMILAGVMLKLGGYGIIRVSPFLNSDHFWIWSSSSMIGGMLVGLLCLTQTDMKALIAYSSIVHMSLIIPSLLLPSEWAILGSMNIMIGHGFTSSVMFFLVYLMYLNTGSRSIFVNKGFISLWFFLALSASMGAPPTLNLMGEIGVIVSLLGISLYFVFPLLFITFMSVAYSIYLYYEIQGAPKESVINVQSSLLIFFHWLPVNSLFMVS